MMVTVMLLQIENNLTSIVTHLIGNLEEMIGEVKLSRLTFLLEI